MAQRFAWAGLAVGSFLILTGFCLHASAADPVLGTCEGPLNHSVRTCVRQKDPCAPSGCYSEAGQCGATATAFKLWKDIMKSVGVCKVLQGDSCVECAKWWCAEGDYYNSMQDGQCMQQVCAALRAVLYACDPDGIWVQAL